MISIESNPRIMMGKPVIAGMRITVELVLERIAAGETIETLVKEHPRLTREAVLAAMSFGDQNPGMSAIQPWHSPFK